MSIQERIAEQIRTNPVILYMKGSAEMPLCGFSARAVNILKAYQIPFTTVDVLQDDEMRQGIKIFSNWPTIPQLYVNGEFIGGSDILNEMHENDELTALFENIRKG